MFHHMGLIEPLPVEQVTVILNTFTFLMQVLYERGSMSPFSVVSAVNHRPAGS